jgi:hypothetical protein
MSTPERELAFQLEPDDGLIPAEPHTDLDENDIEREDDEGYWENARVVNERF